MKTGDCKFGERCKFHHPIDRSAPKQAAQHNVKLTLAGLPRREVYISAMCLVRFTLQECGVHPIWSSNAGNCCHKIKLLFLFPKHVCLKSNHQPSISWRLLPSYLIANSEGVVQGKGRIL